MTRKGSWVRIPHGPLEETVGQGLTVLAWCGFRGRFWRTAVAELQLSERAVHRPRCCRLMSYPAVASRDLLHAPEWRAGGPERDKRSCCGNCRALTVLAHRRPRPARPARGFSAASTDRRWRCHSRRSRRHCASRARRRGFDTSRRSAHRPSTSAGPTVRAEQRYPHSAPRPLNRTPTHGDRSRHAASPRPRRPDRSCAAHQQAAPRCRTICARRQLFVNAVRCPSRHVYE